MNTTPFEPRNIAIMSLSRFCHDAAISDTTAWRWRRQGKLKTVNICGRQYITRDGLAELLRRAEAGEFSVDVPTPARHSR